MRGATMACFPSFIPPPPTVLHLSPQFEAYGELYVNADLGTWLQNVLRVRNGTTGDSPKIAGLLELMRTQGRWAASARLAWARCIAKRMADKAPIAQVFVLRWAPFFERAFRKHAPFLCRASTTDPRRYTLVLRAVAEFEQALCAQLEAPAKRDRIHPGAAKWSEETVRGFVHHAVRGFLRNDMYTGARHAPTPPRAPTRAHQCERPSFMPSGSVHHATPSKADALAYFGPRLRMAAGLARARAFACGSALGDHAPCARDLWRDRALLA